MYGERPGVDRGLAVGVGELATLSCQYGGGA